MHISFIQRQGVLFEMLIFSRESPRADKLPGTMTTPTQPPAVPRNRTATAVEISGTASVRDEESAPLLSRITIRVD